MTRFVLTLLVLLVPALASAQGRDIYGGLLDLACPAIEAKTTYAISTLVRSGGTVTATLSVAANPALAVNDALVITGASDSSFNTLTETTTGEPARIVSTGGGGTTFTYAQSGSDGSSSGGTATRARWGTCKANNRWYFSTPFNHGLWGPSVQKSQSAGNAGGVNRTQLLQAKYATGITSSYLANWADRMNRLYKDLGFNILGEYAESWQLPTTLYDIGTFSAASPDDRHIPTKLPFYRISKHQIALCYWGVSFSNVGKCLATGIKASVLRDSDGVVNNVVNGLQAVDPFDSNFLTTSMNTIDADPEWQSFKSNRYNDYFIGLQVDDSDDMGITRGNGLFQGWTGAALGDNEGAGAYNFGVLALIHSPVTAVTNITPDEHTGSAHETIARDYVLHSDPIFAGKQAIVDWLQGNRDSTGPCTATRSGSTVTMTCSHGFIPHETITVRSCSNSTFNTVAGTGAVVATLPSYVASAANQAWFTYTLAGAGSSATGCVVTAGPGYANISALVTAWNAFRDISWNFGFNFQLGTPGTSIAYTSRATTEEFSHNYTNGNALTNAGGWLAPFTGDRINNSYVDPRLFGGIYSTTSTVQTFRATLNTAGGTKAVDLAFGRADIETVVWAKVRDCASGTALIDLTNGGAGHVVPAGQFLDASGTLRVAAAVWNGTPVVVNFASADVCLDMKSLNFPTQTVTLAHFGLKESPTVLENGYSGFGTAATPVTGESLGTGNASATTFLKTLAQVPDPCSIQIFNNGTLVGGDDCEGPTGYTATNRGTLRGGTMQTPLLNGTFTTDLTGWMSVVTGSGATSAVAGRARLAAGTGSAAIRQMIPVVAGSSYRVRATTFLADTKLRIGSAAGLADLGDVLVDGDGSALGVGCDCRSIAVTATSAELWVELKQDTGATTSEVDSVDVTSVDYTAGTILARFTAPPDIGDVLTINYRYGGWGNDGTGLLDEDGVRGAAWLPTNYLDGKLTGTTAAFQTDMTQAFLYWAKTHFKTTRIAIETSLPNQLFFGTTGMGTLGVPSHAVVYKALAPYVNLLGSNGIPIFKPEPNDNQARLDYIVDAIAPYERPLADWLGFFAPDDSPATNDPVEGYIISTQADRATQYRLQMQRYLTLTTASGVSLFLLPQWWDAYDGDQGIPLNWGFLSHRDNLYDGVGVSRRAGRDAYGYVSGCTGVSGITVSSTVDYCEPGDYGDFVTVLKASNSIWLRYVPRPQRSGAR